MRLPFASLALGAALSSACASSTATDGGDAPFADVPPGSDGSLDVPPGADTLPPGDGPAGTDSPTGTEASPGDAPSACNALVNTAAAVTSVQMPGATPPTMTGGMILPGRYHLTSRTFYRATPAIVEQM